LNRNPLEICREAAAAGIDPKDYVVKSLEEGSLRFACEQPDNPANFPRNMFVWRSNLLGSSGKGHEYMLKYLLGTPKHGVMNEDAASTGLIPNEVEWADAAAIGKADLVTPF